MVNNKISDMKQTAVEFLEIKLKKVMIDNQIQQTLHLFEQAKEMEKEQIIDAYKEFLDVTLPNEVYEQYYNETFNK